MCKLDEGARLDMMYLDNITIAIDTQVGTFVSLRCIVFFAQSNLSLSIDPVTYL